MIASRRAVRNDVQVLVVGGGPAGSAAARALALRGRGVLLVERTAFEPPRLGETLAPELPLFLHPLRLDREQVLARTPHVRSVGRVVAWGSPRLAEHRAIFNPYGGGWHIDRPAFDAALAALAAEAGAEVLLGTRVARLVREDGGVLARLEGPAGERAVRAAFVVDASGPGGWAARALGGEWREDDRLVGVVAMVAAPEPCHDLLVEAAPDGWWYVGPLPDGRLVAALMTDADLLVGRRAPEVWAEALARTVHARARCGAPQAPAVVRKASSGRLRSCALPGLAAVGDAASAYDPLSGRGVLKAFHDAAHAAAAIDRAGARPDAVLEAYAAVVRREYERYRADQVAFYAAERRWLDAPFWARRRAQAVPPPP